MTNEVPDIVVDLPTYEQVEDVKKVVVNTGGRLAGTDGKMYRAKMIDSELFADGVGDDLLNPVRIDYETNYPQIASNVPWTVIDSRDRMHIKDDIYMVFYTSTYVVYDVRLGKILKAHTFSSNDWVMAWHGLYFQDSNYYYVKGYGNPTGTNQYAIAVIRKTNYEYVTVIKQQSEPASVIANWNTVPCGEIGCIGDRFFFSPQTEYIWAYKIIFSNGIPISFAYAGNQTLAAPIKAVVVDGDFIYAFITNSSNTTINKYTYNASTSSFSIAATSTIGNWAPGTSSQWLNKYDYNGDRMLLIGFGTGSSSRLNLYNLSTMTAVSNLFNNYGAYPVMHPNDSTRFYIQPDTQDGIYAGGHNWASLFEYNRVNNSWLQQRIRIPVRTQNTISSGVLSTALYGILSLGRNYAIIFDKRLYANWGTIKTYNQGLGYMKVVQCYEEVTQ